MQRSGREGGNVDVSTMGNVTDHKKMLYDEENYYYMSEYVSILTKCSKDKIVFIQFSKALGAFLFCFPVRLIFTTCMIIETGKKSCKTNSNSLCCNSSTLSRSFSLGSQFNIVYTVGYVCAERVRNAFPHIMYIQSMKSPQFSLRQHNIFLHNMYVHLRGKTGKIRVENESGISIVGSCSLASVRKSRSQRM